MTSEKAPRGQNVTKETIADDQIRRAARDSFLIENPGVSDEAVRLVLNLKKVEKKKLTEKKD